MTLAIALLLSAASAGSPALQSGSLQSGGRARTFQFVEPAGQGGAKPPLFLSLHGRLGQGKGQVELSGMDQFAARHGALVVFPDGVRRSWADARGTSPASKMGVDDVAFLSDLIDHFVRDHRADPHRVYLVGMSNGGMMSLTAGCKLASKIAGVGAVGAEVAVSLSTSCNLATPLTAVIIMGTDDPLVPFNGGSIRSDAAGSVLSAEASAKLWAGWNGCSPTPKVSDLPDKDPTDGTQATESRWSDGCKGGSEVRLITVKGGGHTWPGGLQYAPAFMVGKTSRDFDASEMLWTVLSTHQR